MTTTTGFGQQQLTDDKAPLVGCNHRIERAFRKSGRSGVWSLKYVDFGCISRVIEGSRFAHRAVGHGLFMVQRILNLLHIGQNAEHFHQCEKRERRITVFYKHCAALRRWQNRRPGNAMGRSIAAMSQL
jgi:hypothetical protein